MADAGCRTPPDPARAPRLRALPPHERTGLIRRHLVLAVVLVLSLTTVAQARISLGHAAQRHHYSHHPECTTPRCARHADRLYARRHRPPMSALERCIIEHESGGDPQAVSGIYSGIGQWEQSRWESDGGLRYASTPTGATYAEQERILRGEGEAGMVQQQGQYDGCA